VVLGPPICRGKGYPTSRTCIFKSHLLPTMWLDMVEFRSASSAGSWRKKKEEKRIRKKESVINYNSADMYVEQPNNGDCVHCGP